MTKRGKCASNLKVLKFLPYDLAAIWRVVSASEIIKMGCSRMFGKKFFVALLSNRAKNGRFCLFFPRQANSLR